MIDHDSRLDAAERERIAQIRAEVDEAFAEIRALRVDRLRDIFIPAVFGAVLGLAITGTALFMLGML